MTAQKTSLNVRLKPALAGIAREIAAVEARDRAGALSRGDIADLRRGAEDSIPGAAFWYLADRFLAPHNLLSGSGQNLRTESQWIFLLAAFATLRGNHQSGRALGQVLLESGVSEPRVSRLLRANGEALLDAARGTVRQLAARGAAFDWADLTELVLSDDTRNEEFVRRRIAREYFRAEAKSSRPSDSTLTKTASEQE